MLPSADRLTPPGNRPAAMRRGSGAVGSEGGASKTTALEPEGDSGVRGAEEERGFAAVLSSAGLLQPAQTAMPTADNSITAVGKKALV
ncbi:MAG: hypothetical protein H7145_12395 [Akkermansiaceae bacterium]|nr:hypothetical protein [Armatimonadota bacterium]